MIDWICWKLKWGWKLAAQNYQYERHSDAYTGSVIQTWINCKTGEKRVRIIRWP